MSQNPNISMKEIDNSTHLPWNYQLMGSNPSITWDDIQEKDNITKYNWDYKLPFALYSWCFWLKLNL